MVRRTLTLIAFLVTGLCASAGIAKAQSIAFQPEVPAQTPAATMQVSMVAMNLVGCWDAYYCEFQQPDWSSFQFSVNGTSRTSSFTWISGQVPCGASMCYWEDTVRANVLPLETGSSNTLIGSVDYTGWLVADTAVTQVTATAAAAPQIVVKMRNRGVWFEREACLTVATYGDGATSCGALRHVYGLPGVMTYNKPRGATLVYHSDHVSAPVLRVDVGRTAGTGIPDSAIVRVLSEEPGEVGALIAERRYAGSYWNVDATVKAVGLPLDARRRTGRLRYKVTASFWYGPTQSTSEETGEIVMLDLRASPYGAGWWVAGVERLVSLDQNQLLWVGGDGSLALYSPVPNVSNRWAAPARTRPDTLSLENGYYVRMLPGRVRVMFDQYSGLHVRTENRLGHVTRFKWKDAGRLMLDSIVVPVPAGAPVLAYAFEYTTDGTYRLQRIKAPGATGTRTTIFAIQTNGDWQVWDAANRSIHFTPASGADFLPWLRTDRRNNTASYSYGPAGMLTAADAAVTSADGSYSSVTQTFRSPAGVLGVPNAPPSDTADINYTRIDGPMASPVIDVVQVWSDPRTQAVTKHFTVSYAQTTSVQYGDGRFPLLATRTQDPAGLVHRAGYDDRGNLKADTTEDPLGTGQVTAATNAVTTHLWDGYWDDDTLVTAPTGEVTRFHIDPATGHRMWQQPGNDETRRTSFSYNTLGLLESTTPPGIGSASDYLGYDALGNLKEMRGPLNGTQPLTATAHLDRDGIGQVRRKWQTVVDSVYDRGSDISTPRVRAYTLEDSTFYDVHGRDTLVLTIRPGDGMLSTWVDSYGTQSYDQIAWQRQVLKVYKEYDDEDNVLEVLREGWDQVPGSSSTGGVPLIGLTTRYQFDQLGRQVRETAPDGAKDSLVYDPAGRQTRHLTRNGDVLKLEYDALGRLTKRIIPAKSYARRTYAGISMPHYAPNGAVEGIARGANVVLPADTNTFAYDGASRMIQANNREARVSRTYYPNGLLKTDTLRTGRYDYADAMRQTTAWTDHAYGLEYTYDLSGRRKSMRHPQGLLNNNARPATTYHYNALGERDSIITPYGSEQFGFGYDEQGRLQRTVYPNGVEESRWYDLAGRLALRKVEGAKQRTSPTETATFTNGVVKNIEYSYDVLGRLTYALDRSSHEAARSQYAPSGELVRNLELVRGDLTSVAPQNIQFWRFDPLGNRTTQANRGSSPSGTPTIDSTEYNLATGRLTRTGIRYTNTTTWNWSIPNEYDAAGNLLFSDRMRLMTKCVLTSPDCAGGYQTLYQHEVAANYYGADGKLRLNDRWSNDNQKTPGGLEEYRYDALGRRVLRRYRRECRTGSAGAPCGYLGEVMRYVYDDASILYEIRAVGRDTAKSATMERDLINASVESDSLWDFGVYLNTYGSVLDQPLAVRKVDAYWLPGSGTLYPHLNLKGSADVATVRDGSADLEARLWHNRISPFRDQVAAGVDEEAGMYYGSLLGQMTDGSRLMYMRNRYYDPGSGRFTQEDPIRLAGGLNAYGFAGGDPVNFSDPFGLCPMCLVVAGAALQGAAEGALLGAAEQMAVNALTGRPLSEGVAKSAAIGAGVGAVTAGVGSAARMWKAVSTAGKATSQAEIAVVASRAEANAAGKTFVGGGARPMSPNRKTGQLVGEINDATGNKARWVHTDPPPGMQTPHANLENAAGGNTHVQVIPTGTKSWWPW